MRFLFAATILSLLCALAFPLNAQTAPADIAAETAQAQAWFDTAFGAAPNPSGVPFSFVYGGNPSATLLAGWETKLESEKSASGRKLRVLTYTDPATRLEIRCEATCFTDSPAVEWVLYATNKGASDTPILEGLLPMNLGLEVPQGVVKMHHARGSQANEMDFRPEETVISIKGKRGFDLAGFVGRSSETWMPYFNLEHAGGGVVGAIGWSGQWALHSFRDEKQVHLQAGQQTFRAKLHPGETIRTPRVLLLFWKGDDKSRGNNLLRRLLLKHYTPRIDGEVAIPPIALITFWSTPKGGVTEENQKVAIQTAAKAGCEAFWMDAGWFEGGYPLGVGSWVPKPDAFPNGLKPVSDEAHRKGMKFILWFEPERVSATSRIAKEHPEWVLHSSTPEDPYGLFNFADPAARTWMTDHLSKCIGDWGVDVLRIDCNITPKPFWQKADAADRKGVTEAHYIEGIYTMWDDLKTRHPGLLIDNCASGGKRLDLELLSRSYPLWQSDAQSYGFRPDLPLPAMAQSQNAGLSLFLPLHSGGVWGFDTYRFRSMATTGVAICPNITKDESQMPQIRKMLEEAKSLRPLALGDYYPLTEINTNEQAWCAWQYDRPDLGKGYIMAFRRNKSPFVTAQFPLRGLEPNADYVLTNADTQESKTIKGSALARGFSLDMPEPNTSALIIYQKVKQE